MKLRQVIVAEKILLDHGLLTPTAVGIMTEVEITYQLGGDAPPEVQLELFPFNFMILATWIREEGDSGEAEPFNCWLTGPNEYRADLKTQPVMFGPHRRFHTRMVLEALPYSGDGDYTFHFSLEKAPDDEIGNYSFEFKAIRQMPEAIAAPTKA